MKRSQAHQILTYSIFITLLAQISLNIFATNFRVSMGILLLPVLVFLDHRTPALPITLLSGLGVYLSRVLLHSLSDGFEPRALVDFSPELVFYLIYGCLFHLYFRHHQYRIPHQGCYIFLFFMDYLANFSELLCRIRLDAFWPALQVDIMLVALVRTLILWAIINGLSQYRFLLISTAHAQRYQRLILLISKLNAEIIWMRKNSAMVEDAMAKSYRLYAQLQEKDADPELTQSALTVAKDIHEVKKEYALILRGISEALDLNLRDEAMPLSDILTVLRNSMTQLAEQNETQLEFEINIQSDFKTDKHYFLLSLLRNLFTNAVEASRGKHIVLSFSQTENEQDYQFEITDNGCGIPKENLEHIFKPGFSTKINFETGEINRGLGLNLVDDLVRNQLHGGIRVESWPGRTVFTITVPKEQLEVQET